MDDIQNLFKETIAEFMGNGLESELDEELEYSKYDYKNKDTDNSRNGHSSKTLRTSFGDVDVSASRDRKGEFEPQLLKKKQTSISQDIEEKILSMYAKGMRNVEVIPLGRYSLSRESTQLWISQGQLASLAFFNRLASFLAVFALYSAPTIFWRRLRWSIFRKSFE